MIIGDIISPNDPEMQKYSKLIHLNYVFEDDMTEIEDIFNEYIKQNKRKREIKHKNKNKINNLINNIKNIFIGK